MVVSFNTRQLLDDCLRSILSETPSRVVVVDNASSDGSAQMVAECFPQALLVRNQRNVGFGRAANQGIGLCDEPYVLVLNADTILTAGCIRRLADWMESHPRAAMVGPRLLDATGRLQASQRSFPTAWDLLLDWCGLYRLAGRVPTLCNVFPRTRPHNRVRSVAWVVGAALAVRRAAFEAVGGFDPSFFLYYEEVDLAYRLADAGWDIQFAPIADVLHVGGASTRQWSEETTVQYYRALAQFYDRHYGRAQQQFLAILIPCVSIARLLRDAVRWTLASNPVRRQASARDLAAWARLIRGDWRGLGPAW